VSESATENQYLVFTDLDGSLLDHQTYSYAAALPVLARLQRNGIPVIFVSSKTRAEIASLRQSLGIDCPFIVENGAAVFIPEGYFPFQPEQTNNRDGYWVFEMSEPRERWLGLLTELEKEFQGEFDYFYRAGVEGISQMTGLPLEQATQANFREYSEPVKWRGSEERKVLFLDRLLAAGATVLQGGRFLGVSGNHDKGTALRWLRAVYQQASPASRIDDLAIGDSGNDCAMLEAAGTALLIRSPAHDFPHLSRAVEEIMFSAAPGPDGWAEGVERWLSAHSSNLKEGNQHG